MPIGLNLNTLSCLEENDNEKIDNKKEVSSYKNSFTNDPQTYILPFEYYQEKLKQFQLDLDKHYCNNIGRPLLDLSAYVFDEHSNPVAIVVIGELYIAGPGLARGYLNRDDLTKKIFFISKQGTRLYKTGDLVRWLPDGSLEYVGRVDKQLKIRGFRIEAGEIEAALLQHPDVSQAVVIVDKEKRLVAYYTSENKTISDEVLHQALRQRLPDI